MHDEHEPGHDLHRQLRDTSIAARAFLVAYALIGAFGGFYGGYLLLHETRHWASWLIALVILEPIGLACALTVLVILSPDSIFATLLTGAARRAAVAVSLIGAAFVLFIAGTLAYVTWYFMTAGD